MTTPFDSLSNFAATALRLPHVVGDGQLSVFDASRFVVPSRIVASSGYGGSAERILAILTITAIDHANNLLTIGSGAEGFSDVALSTNTKIQQRLTAANYNAHSTAINALEGAGVGTQGSQGSQGAPSTIPGPQGGAGPQGSQGQAGIGTQGSQGSQGAPSTIPGPQGGAGPQGSQGQAGIGTQGPQGSQGAPSTIPGPQGGPGSQGQAGSQGSQGFQGSQGSASTVPGPQGSQGSQGGAGSGASPGGSANELQINNGAGGFAASGGLTTGGNGCLNMYSSGGAFNLSQPIDGVGVVIAGAGNGGDAATLRIVPQVNSWADGVPTAYFQASLAVSYTLNLSFVAGKYGYDRRFNRLQFLSDHTSISSYGFIGNTPVPTATFEVVNGIDQPAIKVIQADGRVFDYLQFCPNNTASPISGVDGHGYMRTALTSGAPTTTPATGSMAYDATANKLYIFDGTTWQIH